MYGCPMVTNNAKASTEVAEDLRAALFAISEEHEERWLALSTERGPLAAITDKQRKLAAEVAELQDMAVRPRGEELTKLHPTEDRLAEVESLNGVELYKQGVKAVLEVTARQGGGNDECYCETGDDSHEPGCLWASNEAMRARPEYLHDEYDDFDSTYLTMYFALTEAQVDAALAIEEAEFEERMTARLLENAEKLELTPWSALGSADDHAKAGELQAKLRDLHRRRGGTKKLVETVKALRAAEEFGDKLKDGEGTLNFTALTDALDTIKRHIRPSRFASFDPGECERRIVNRWHELSLAKTRVAEAEQLPEDSALREYLLGDRGQGSYMTKEKRGRRKVEVRKVYNRGSVLGKELESAEKSYATVLRLKHQSLRRYLDHQWNEAKKIAGAEEFERVLQAEGELDGESEHKALLDELFAVGWPGKPEKLPAMPEAMFPSLRTPR